MTKIGLCSIGSKCPTIRPRLPTSENIRTACGASPTPKNSRKSRRADEISLKRLSPAPKPPLRLCRVGPLADGGSWFPRQRAGSRSSERAYVLVQHGILPIGSHEQKDGK